MDILDRRYRSEIYDVTFERSHEGLWLTGKATLYDRIEKKKVTTLKFSYEAISGSFDYAIAKGDWEPMDFKLIEEIFTTQVYGEIDFWFDDWKMLSAEMTKKMVMVLWNGYDVIAPQSETNQHLSETA